MSSHGPRAASRVDTAGFVAWAVCGLALAVYSAYLSHVYFSRHWVESTFTMVNPPPGYAAERSRVEMIPHLHLAAAVYALAGLGVFRRWGWVAVALAAAIGGGPLLCHLADGLGRL